VTPEPRRRVLITGVLGGIGRATAAAFRADGWWVIGTDRNTPSNDVDVDDLISIDLKEPDAVARLIDQIAGDTLDGLVNNAAYQANLGVADTPDEVWDEVMTTNLRAPFQLIRDLAPRLARVRGGIVNVSSVHAITTSANVAAYAISKGALVSLTRSTAIDLAASGVRCNAVLPGAIQTSMLWEGLSRRPHPKGAQGNLEDLEARTPLQFVAQPEAVAPTILHLVDTERSPYTTGQTIVLDGGASVRLSTE
jgi:NAD(P)-dependent dehydrogenase (short-subunit alcohol dehydrogenase family)